ncbi:MAG: dTMP kinase [Myxococcales bacterium]|nr:dTMP kinase [Myxococcales bacterium]
MSRLIVIEGLDGAGTTTQARLVVEALRQQGVPAHLTREPSDGPVGRLIREMLVGQHSIDGQPLSQTTFSLLFAADRLDHLQREVEPALARGEVVISDRWYHSSLAYQGTATERAWIDLLNQRARRPDLTVLLRVRAETAARRRLAAGRAQELFEDLAMQERVAAGYDQVFAALTDREPVVVLDGEREVDRVFAELMRQIAPLLPAR